MIFYCNVDVRRFLYFVVLVYAFQAFVFQRYIFKRLGFLSTGESSSLFSGNEFC